ncbi:MAG: LysM peptidoglycan-binding domain-containing protein [Gammaproteobacteria bacterium]|nr:LysM peptidoglycan-binding domain-containing protein [Gammaproteobacteria bacterium]
MYKKISLILVLVGGCLSTVADTLELQADHPQSYTVQKGDTLWDISGQFLTEPWRWPELWEVNPQIENPHLIYPGDVLTLTYKDGRPLLGVRRGGGRNITLSPQVREYSHGDAVAPIPLDAIQPFLSEPQVVAASTLASSPYIVSSEDEHLVNGQGARVYIRGLGELTDSRFGIYRSGKVYQDPDDGDAIIGYEALHVGEAVVERLGDPATARIVSSSREVFVGDRLLPHADVSMTEFVPRAPGQPVAGRVISVIDGVSQIGQHQVVVLSVGASDGIEPGHVLGIFQSGKVAYDRVGAALERQREAGQPVKVGNNSTWIENALSAIFTDVRDTKRAIDDALGVEMQSRGTPVDLPEERTGELVVFRTFDQVSYALVMEIRRPVHINDRVRNP